MGRGQKVSQYSAKEMQSPNANPLFAHSVSILQSKT